MKRVANKIAVVVAATLISALPVLAGEGMGGAMQDQGQAGNRDECLLMAKNCTSTDPMQQDSIQQRIARINREIGKGTAVYTEGELRQLRSQLNDARGQMELLEFNGGS